jgi:hypothetical protein
LLSSDRPSIRVNINSPQVRDYFFGNNKLKLSTRLVSSLEVFLSIISNSGLDKYYICYLGGVIVFINNKLITDGDIPNNKIRILSIIKFSSSSEYQESRQKAFFLENNIRIYKEGILLLLLELELNNKSTLDKLLSEVIGSGSCFNFFDFLFLFFFEGLQVLKNTRKE